jgi:anaerobic selenocysteine-containing dehydrogenase
MSDRNPESGRTDERPTREGRYPGGGEWILSSAPGPEQWDDWKEYDPAAWPRKVEHRYKLVPTICFNCESACGLLAYVDKETGEIRRFEGNPVHPGSRGRVCAKGPATINQVKDPERILHPLKRVGERGGGEWERVSWDAALDDIGGRIRKVIAEGRGEEVMYHVGRPGYDGTMDRVLKAWGVDGHNSHTNICSSAARLGYALWHQSDRPSPDHARAKFILLLSAHLEAGHYFNPHAQRIIEGKARGAKIAVLDPRRSNTASMADFWLPTWPGTEAAVLLAMANVLIDEDLHDREFLRRWVNWEAWLDAEHPEAARRARERGGAAPGSAGVDEFVAAARATYAEFTPEFAARESGIPAATIVEVAREIGRARGALSTHVWRGAASGNLGGWQVARCLEWLVVLTGSVATPGGTTPAARDKFTARMPLTPPPFDRWNELTFPPEYPLSHHELSFLLPHFLKEGRGRVEVYFTRVYNPVWTNPDGLSWIVALRDPDKVGCHVALTPTWNESAYWADYVLPMGHGPERHDIMSQETSAGAWVAFRQPVLRAFRQAAGETVRDSRDANPGEVWEEDEFWIDLSWRVDPDGALGIRRWFESPDRPGEKLTVDDYYGWIFENSVPGLPEAAAAQGLSPLQYMRRFGAFRVKTDDYRFYERPAPPEEKGVHVDGLRVAGFDTPSRKLEFYSSTMVEFGWPEHTIPGYVRSHVHWSELDRAAGEAVLLPTFRLPTLIHTRSANAKWLVEISHRNPLWVHPADARRIGIGNDDLVRVNTAIGWFVVRAWVTEGLRPGIVACSHHMGRWRLGNDAGVGGWTAAPVSLTEDRGEGGGVWRIRHERELVPFESDDPDSARIWWSDAGVHQNLAFPVQPDPVSGMHCWHQKVRLEPARGGDRYGDVVVDTAKSHAIYREWLAMARPAKPGGLRRPLWFSRPVRPADSAYRLGRRT